jgi:hypothetical protein
MDFQPLYFFVGIHPMIDFQHLYFFYQKRPSRHIPAADTTGVRLFSHREWLTPLSRTAYDYRMNRASI